jgi:SAM-dependent methyltransferase
VSVVGTIEHLKRPLETLREIHRVVGPGGLILVQTPNLASLQYRHQGENWEQFTPPGHLVYFVPRTLRAMLKAAGFRRVRFDMPFPLEAGWEYGAASATARQRGERPFRLLLARLASLLGSRCEVALQRLKGRLVGKHDIVSLARKSWNGAGGRR